MYLKPSELANMFNLNKQTLLYYEKEGLLVPEFRDPDTGYRKYLFQQIYRLALICYLRKIGFSIEQIKGYIQQRSMELSVQELRRRSADIRKHCEHILNIDGVIQRKILFVEQKMRELTPGTATERYFLRRAYLPLGKEERIYSKEEFYFYPTIALYKFDREKNSYETTFGAYIESLHGIDMDIINDIQYIEAQKFLCYCWKGNYKEIAQKIRELQEEYSHLPLSSDTYNFNIVDQFMEKDVDQYITEIQIPILGTKAAPVTMC